MIEQAEKAKVLFKEKTEGHRLHGEALVMIGQAEEDAEKAIQVIDEGMTYIRKGIALCLSLKASAIEKELEQQLLKARKVMQLKQRRHTRQEKEALLDRLKQTMDLYSELMSQHSKSSLERDNP